MARNCDLQRSRASTSRALSHRISDGDTLSKLAVEYLGSADRYLEIFEYNRDVLTKPDLLPIGKTLKIPPRDRAFQTGSATVHGPESATPKMVPIPPGALRRVGG